MKVMRDAPRASFDTGAMRNMPCLILGARGGVLPAVARRTIRRARSAPSPPPAPAGISDIFMRALGEELRKRWGQPIIVENRPGGMQNVGARACPDAPPDGYTICILNADPMVYNQFLLKSMPFDPENGLQPVTNLFHLIHTLVVNSQLEASRTSTS